MLCKVPVYESQPFFFFFKHTVICDHHHHRTAMIPAGYGQDRPASVGAINVKSTYQHTAVASESQKLRMTDHLIDAGKHLIL